MACVGADADWAADVIEDDGGAGKGLREVDHVVELGVIHPCIEREAARGEAGEAAAELGVE